jgi:hypothetical protein
MVFVAVAVGGAITITIGGIGLLRINSEPLLTQVPNMVRHLKAGKNVRTFHPPLPLLGPDANTKKIVAH